MDCFEDVADDISKAPAIAAVLVRLIESNKTRLRDWRQGCGSSFVGATACTRFESAYAPEISIEAYVERVYKFSKASNCVYVIAMIYIDRLIEGEGLVVTALNVHRLFITCILVAAKFYDDEFFKNAFYATLGGIDASEMNMLEIDLLNMIKFSLFVSPESYASYKKHLLFEESFGQTLIPPSSPVSIVSEVNVQTSISCLF